MPHMSEILDDIPQRPRSLVRVTEVVPEWVVGTTYKSGGFLFLLREMDTDGMTLEILETEIADAELVAMSPLKGQKDLDNIMRDQNDKTLPVNPQSIVPRSG